MTLAEENIEWTKLNLEANQDQFEPLPLTIEQKVKISEALQPDSSKDLSYIYDELSK